MLRLLDSKSYSFELLLQFIYLDLVQFVGWFSKMKYFYTSQPTQNFSVNIVLSYFSSLFLTIHLIYVFTLRFRQSSYFSVVLNCITYISKHVIEAKMYLTMLLSFLYEMPSTMKYFYSNLISGVFYLNCSF